MHGLADVTLLAGNNFGDVESDGIVGPLGLLIIVLLAVATVLLIRNMNARLRRLPASFDPPEPDNDAHSSGTEPVPHTAGAQPSGNSSDARPSGSLTSGSRPGGIQP